MQNAALDQTTFTDNGFAGLLKDYRFRIADTAEEFAAALELRREVYCGDFGYDIPVPDEYDHRSWLLVAESVESGEIVGTMRITPREYGTVEAEEYFRLPTHLASRRVIEISRFAIKRSHRKTSTFLPVISLGLFKLCYEFSLFIGADYQIVCSKAEKMWTYLSMGFRSTGITKKYEKLNGAEHELLFHEFRRAVVTLEGNPFHELFCEASFDEVSVPTTTPRTNLVDEPFAEPLRMAANG